MKASSPAALSLRARLLVIGVFGLAVALFGGGTVLYVVLSRSVQNNLVAGARAAATDVAALVDAGSVPVPLPVSGAQVVQVVDIQNRVLAFSALADRLTSLLTTQELTQGRSGTVLTVPGSRAAQSGPLRAVVVRAGPGPGGGRGLVGAYAVIAAVPVGDADRGIASLRTALLIGFPVLLLILAAIAWVVIGRALRPVEGLRAAAARISGTQADEQLPVPRAADEIRALAVTLNDMLGRLGRARERQREFVADAAHELRSPLASLRVQLEVAQRLGRNGELSPELPGELLADVERLGRLVEDLLLLARTDAAAGPPVRWETVDISALIRDVAAGYADARVPVTVPNRSVLPWTTEVDALSRMLVNVLDNAVRSAESAVALEVENGDSTLRIAVIDDGAGIPEDARERVFQRFTRLDDARIRAAGGSGLGLAIVAALAERVGGSVRLSDARPHAADGTGDLPGLRVEITLPSQPSRP